MADKNMVGERRYLGDAVTAVYDGWQIELSTSDGVRVTNRIFLEPETLAAFESYVIELKAWIASVREPR